MRRLFAGCIAFICVVFVCLAAQPGASLRLGTNELDLGDIDKDSIGVGNVRFYNDGTDPLVIFSIISDCHCTDMAYTKDPVAPGDSGVIAVRYYTQRREPGPFRKAVRIRSNAQHTKILFIKGRVKRPYHK